MREHSFKVFFLRGHFSRVSFSARIFRGFLSAQEFLRTIDLLKGLLLAANRVEQDGVYCNPVISSGIDLDLPLLPLHYWVSKTLVKKLI